MVAPSNPCKIPVLGAEFSQPPRQNYRFWLTALCEATFAVARDILPTGKPGGFYRQHDCAGVPTSYCRSCSALMSQRIESLRTSQVRFSLLSLNVLRDGLPIPTGNIQWLRCAALDFFRYHPITGLCSACPAELSESIAQMVSKCQNLRLISPNLKVGVLRRFFDNSL